MTANPEGLSVAALPAGTGLLADHWEVEVAGGWVVPSEEPMVLEPACSEQLSAVQPSQWGASITGIQLVP